MAEPDRQKIAADWASRGFGCDLWTDAPGQRWEDFRDPTDELVSVLVGQMEFEIAGVVHHPQIGEELNAQSDNAKRYRETPCNILRIPQDKFFTGAGCGLPPVCTIQHGY